MDDAEIQDIAQLMWEAPFAVLSHDLEESSDAPKYVTVLKQPCNSHLVPTHVDRRIA